MAADPGFLLRLNAETARLLQHQDRQGRPISQWQVVVICPSRELNFGDPTPVREFVERRVVWIELQPERLPRSAPPLQKALAMLLLPEDQLPTCSKAIRAEAAGTCLDAEIDDVIAAILVSRFNGRTIPEIVARGWDPGSDPGSDRSIHPPRSRFPLRANLVPQLGPVQAQPASRRPDWGPAQRPMLFCRGCRCRQIDLPGGPTRDNFHPPHRAAPRAQNLSWRTSCWPVSLPTAPRWPSCLRPTRPSARWWTSCRSSPSSSCCWPLCGRLPWDFADQVNGC